MQYKLRMESWKIWFETSQATGDLTKPLTSEHVQNWREQGVAVVDGLLPMQLIHDVQDEAMRTLLPDPDNNDFGSGGKMEFPCGLPAVAWRAN